MTFWFNYTAIHFLISQFFILFWLDKWISLNGIKNSASNLNSTSQWHFGSNIQNMTCLLFLLTLYTVFFFLVLRCVALEPRIFRKQPSLHPQGSGRVCVHYTLSRLHLWDFTRYVVVDLVQLNRKCHLIEIKRSTSWKAKMTFSYLLWWKHRSFLSYIHMHEH